MATNIYGSRNFFDSILLKGQKEVRFADSDSSNYAAIKAPATLSANYTLTLPTTDGSSGELLSTDGSGVLSWVSALTTTLTESYVFIGNASNIATATDTAAQGDITATSTGGLEIKAGVIVNADINSSAAIAYSKLNLATSIVNGDISASAAIAYSKLSLTGSIVNADVNASAAIAYSKLNLSASIVNADIASGAAIDATKIADGSISNTEFQYLNGVTSAIQTQLDAKVVKAVYTWSNADGAAKTITHSLGSTDVLVQLYDPADGSTVEVDTVVRTDANTLDLTASQAPAVSWKVIILK